MKTEAENFRAVLFDLDGTLVDAFTTIHRTYCHVLPQFGLPEPTRAQVIRAVGGGLENAMRHFVSEDILQEAVRRHVAYTEKILLEDPVLYPGAGELVRALKARGVRTAVFTNKIGEHARAIIGHLGLDPMFDVVLGARDTRWRKPDREFTEEALRRLGASAAEACLIGDSPFDVQAARVCELRCFCVTTGTHDAAQLSAVGADAVFPDMRSLAQSVFALSV